ncbi:MAG: hypothetical protein Q9172_006509 [Xanthocarpia lactea]
MPGTCSHGYVTPYVSGVFNIISDFYILFLPLPFIWQLKMNMKRKIRVMAVFSVGLFIVRLAYTTIYVNDKDITWAHWVLSLWSYVVPRILKPQVATQNRKLNFPCTNSVLEVDIGIICACSLALPAFIDRYGPKLSPLLLKSKLYSYFSTTSHGESSGGPQTHGSNVGINSHKKGIPTSSQSSDVLRSDHQSEQREGHEKDPAFGVKAFGTVARGDRHNLAFETNVEGGGRTAGDEDVECTHPEGKIMKRVDLFQSYPRRDSERSLRDEERGGLQD